ncbi:MAG TPA: sigma-70 family RNA polymerase sigma factor [Planctomycetota bacterium]
MSEFQSTLWTVIRGAGKGEEAALRDFVLKYRPPVLAYLARRGFRAEAEDLAQEVFLRVFQDRVLLKADPSLGRFRSLLLSVTRHVLGHHVERELAKKRQAPSPTPEPALDEDFDREWVAHLIEVALARLAKEHPNYHDALRASLEGGTPADYNHVARGKKKLAEYLKDQVRDYSASRAELDEELRFLSRFFPR